MKLVQSQYRAPASPQVNACFQDSPPNGVEDTWRMSACAGRSGVADRRATNEQLVLWLRWCNRRPDRSARPWFDRDGQAQVQRLFSRFTACGRATASLVGMSPQARKIVAMTSEYEPIPANADGTRLACAVCGEEFDAGEASRHYYAEHRAEWKRILWGWSQPTSRQPAPRAGGSSGRASTMISRSRSGTGHEPGMPIAGRLAVHRPRLAVSVEPFKKCQIGSQRKVQSVPGEAGEGPSLPRGLQMFKATAGSYRMCILRILGDESSGRQLWAIARSPLY